MRVGSLFSGIGGLELGLERAGLGPTVWQVESDDYCRRVLERHWPDATRYTDVRDVDWSQVDPVDLVCGGFPCQPFSSAGQRGGEADERWMWPEFARCVRALRPRYVVVENVTALLDDRRAFGAVIAGLAACGYDAEWDCLPAAAVGAPHRRDRLFVVAYPSSAERGAPQQPVLASAGRRAAEPRERGGGSGPDDGWWDAEPNVGRVADGIPDGLDRLRVLSNAVVPQVAQSIGECIALAETERERGAA